MLKSKDGNIALLNAEAFINSYKTPTFVIKGVLQSGYLTALTAQIGHGKTALLSYMAFCVALGLDFGGHQTTKGRVIYVAGENDQDVIQRFAAQAQLLGISKIPENLQVMTTHNSHDFLKSMEGMEFEGLHENVDLVIIDTATSIYNGSDENENMQQKDFANKVRNLIEKFPGNPSIVIACHPPKNANDKSSLRPRGGSALYGEIDCAMTLVRKKKVITLEAAEKYRGQAFEPMNFMLQDIKCDRIRDSDGLPINSVAISSGKSASIAAKHIDKKCEHSDPDLNNSVFLAIKEHKQAKLSDILHALFDRAPSKSDFDHEAMKKVVKIALTEMIKDSFITLKGKTYSVLIEHYK